MASAPASLADLRKVKKSLVNSLPSFALNANKMIDFDGTFH